MVEKKLIVEKKLFFWLWSDKQGVILNSELKKQRQKCSPAGFFIAALWLLSPLSLLPSSFK